MDDSGVWDVGSTRRDSRTLADRVAEARHRAVVGREEEVAALRRFLEPEARERIWFLVGPGGIGKTTLLQTLRDQARRDGGACLYLDARRIDPNPLAARQALEQLCAPSDLAAFCAGHPRLVLFLDTFEVWQDLEFWLREELLPSLPLDLRVIIASRVAPSLEWCADPGWRELLSVSYLDDLPAAACQEYLAHRGIQGQDREALIRFSGGRPLVLALGADMLADGYSLDAGLEAPSLIGRLVDCFTREARCPEQRQALDASAVASVAHVLPLAPLPSSAAASITAAALSTSPRIASALTSMLSDSWLLATPYRSAASLTSRVASPARPTAA